MESWQQGGGGATKRETETIVRSVDGVNMYGFSMLCREDNSVQVWEFDTDAPIASATMRRRSSSSSSSSSSSESFDVSNAALISFI